MLTLPCHVNAAFAMLSLLCHGKAVPYYLFLAMIRLRHVNSCHDKAAPCYLCLHSWCGVGHDSPSPSNAGSARSFHRDTERGIQVLRYCEVLQRGDAYAYRCAIRAQRVTLTGTCAQVEHHKEGVSDWTWSYTAYTGLPQIDDEQCHTQTYPELENGPTHYTVK